MRNTTPSGWIQFGPANSSHAHIYTNLSNFYFNVNTLYTNGNLVWTAGNDGSGSGLDADLLDGYNLSSGLDASTVVLRDGGVRVYTHLGAVNANSNWVVSFQATPTTGYSWHGDISAGGPTGTWWFYESMRHSNGSSYWGTQIAWGWEDNANQLYQRNVTGNSFSGWVKYWNSGNDGAGSGLDADVLDGYDWMQAGKEIRAAEYYTDGWFRNYNSGYGLYNQSTGNHWYSDGQYWNIGYSGTTGIRLRNGHAGSIMGYLYAETSGRFGLLSNDGSWAVSIAPSVGGKYVLIGGSYDNNAYNSTSGIRLLLGGGDADAIGNYYIGTNLNNYNGNYTKLDLAWHTGIRIGAQGTYGGVRIFDSEDFGTRLFSVGEGDTHVRVTNILYAGSDIVAYSSDIRLKENIKPIQHPVDKIMKLNGVHYTWKDMVTDVGFTPSQKEEVGVLAQEVQEVLPEVVTNAPFDSEINPSTGKLHSKSGQNYLTVKYDKLIPLLIEAIKEQQHTIQELKSTVDMLQNKLLGEE